jgi:hypothetical protein
LLHAPHRPSRTGGLEEPFATVWRAISGGCPSRGDSPETRGIARTEIDRALDLLPRLKRIRRMVVVGYLCSIVASPASMMWLLAPRSARNLTRSERAPAR